MVGRVDLLQELPDPAPAASTFYARVAVHEVLLGNARSLEPGWVDIRLLRGITTPIEELASLMPDHLSLFFLADLEVSAEQAGLPSESASQWRYRYAINGPGGIIGEIDRTARVHDDWLELAPLFPNEFEGQPFDDVVQQVRDEIAETAGG